MDQRRFVFVEGTKPTGRIIPSNLGKIRSHAAKGKRARKDAGSDTLSSGAKRHCSDTDELSSTGSPATSVDEEAALAGISLWRSLAESRLFSVDPSGSWKRIHFIMTDYIFPVWDQEHLFSIVQQSPQRQSVELSPSYSAHVFRRFERMFNNEFDQDVLFRILSCLYEFHRGAITKSSDFYVGRALATMPDHSDKRNKSIDFNALALLVHCSRVEWRLGHIQSAETYMSIVGSIIRSLGGLERVAPFIASLVLMVDKYISISLMKVPIIPTPDPGPMPLCFGEGLRRVPALAKPVTGSALLYQLAQCSCPDEIQNVIVDMITVAQIVQEYEEAAEFKDHMLQGNRWLFLKNVSWVHNLLSLIVNRGKFSPEVTTLVAGTLMWLVLATSQVDPPKIPPVIFNDLLKIMEDRFQDEVAGFEVRPQLQDGTLIWIATLATMCESRSLQRNAFRRYQKVLAAEIGLATDWAFKELLDQYLFLGVRQLPLLNS